MHADAIEECKQCTAFPLAAMVLFVVCGKLFFLEVTTIYNNSIFCRAAITDIQDIHVIAVPSRQNSAFRALGRLQLCVPLRPFHSNYAELATEFQERDGRTDRSRNRNPVATNLGDRTPTTVFVKVLFVHGS